jgi:alkylation response protein AidB-like acyl-CoA dehydrogenase
VAPLDTEPLDREPFETEPLGAFRQRAATWIADNLPPIPPGGLPGNPMASDEDPPFAHQRALQRRLWDGGFAGLAFPVAYGGRGLTPDHQRVFVEEARGHEYPFRFTMPTIGIIGATLFEFGTEDQKRRYLPEVLRGDALWVQFLSEPTCGSDLAGARTRATRDGEGWVLNGSKVWSSAAYGCQYGLCLARTNWDVPKHRGLTMFVVPTDSPGLQMRRIRQVDGSMEFCEEFFDDVVLPADAVVGDIDQGWTVASRLLGNERDSVGGSSPWIGPVVIERGAGRDAGPLVDEAIAAGRAADPRVRTLVAQAHVQSVVNQQLVRRVAARVANGTAEGPEGAILKLARGTAEASMATTALQLAGTDAVVATHPDDAPGATSIDLGVGFVMRQARSLAGGSNEMQRNLIAERLLGMPREHAPDSGVPFAQVRAQTPDTADRSRR